MPAGHPNLRSLLVLITMVGMTPGSLYCGSDRCCGAGSALQPPPAGCCSSATRQTVRSTPSGCCCSRNSASRNTHSPTQRSPNTQAAGRTVCRCHADRSAPATPPTRSDQQPDRLSHQVADCGFPPNPSPSAKRCPALVDLAPVPSMLRGGLRLRCCVWLT